MGKSPFLMGKITIFNEKITIFNGKTTIFNGKVTIFNGKITISTWLSRLSCEDFHVAGLGAQSRRGDPAELRPFGGEGFQSLATATAAGAEGDGRGLEVMGSNDFW